MRANHGPGVLFRPRRSSTFLKAATSVVSWQDATNFYQSRIIILTMGLRLKTATSVVSRQEAVDGYNEGIVHSYEQRLKTIQSRLVNRVHVLDFAGLTDGMRLTLGDRLRMLYVGDDGEALMSDTKKGLDVADTLCFQLSGARRRMTWRQFILALSLHSEEEMSEPRFGAYLAGSERVIPEKGDLRDYWIEISSDRDFLGPAPSYVHIRDPVRRHCHMMIACSISGRGQGAEKVTRVVLFYLWTMDCETANLPYLLAQYLFRFAEGRKSRARLSGGHFI
ncbi:hypothetical protein Tco_1100786, partial [Tanacetum coccineum]